MAMSENGKKILTYLKGIGTTNVTAADVAEELGLPKKTVDGCFTGLTRKNLGERVVAKVETEDGVKEVKFLKLNDAGMAFDPDAPVADAE